VESGVSPPCAHDLAADHAVRFLPRITRITLILSNYSAWSAYSAAEFPRVLRPSLEAGHVPVARRTRAGIGLQPAAASAIMSR
jgi:hypothetical protein